MSVTKKRNDDVHSFRFYKIKQRWRLIYKKGYIPPNNHKKKREQSKNITLSQLFSLPISLSLLSAKPSLLIFNYFTNKPYKKKMWIRKIAWYIHQTNYNLLSNQKKNFLHHFYDVYHITLFIYFFNFKKFCLCLSPKILFLIYSSNCTINQNLNSTKKYSLFLI